MKKADIIFIVKRIDWILQNDESLSTESKELLSEIKDRLSNGKSLGEVKAILIELLKFLRFVGDDLDLFNF